jgi:hypothetical protein
MVYETDFIKPETLKGSDRPSLIQAEFDLLLSELSARQLF